jgi:hypothetical protein
MDPLPVTVSVRQQLAERSATLPVMLPFNPVVDDDAQAPSLLELLWSRRWTVAAATFACALLALIYCSLATPIYASTAALLIQPNAAVPLAGQAAPPISDNYIQTRADVARSGPVLRPTTSSAGCRAGTSSTCRPAGAPTW